MDIGYTISLKDEAGNWLERRPLAELAALRLYRFPSVREVKSHRHQPNKIGYFWMARTQKHVFHESWEEMFALMQLDFNPKLMIICPQPFILHYGERYWHVPDYFAWMEPAQGLVVDVKPEKYLNRERNARAFKATAEACRLIGWQYKVETNSDQIFLQNLSWFAACRLQPAHYEEYAGSLIDHAPMPYGLLVDACGPSWAVRPVLNHLIWQRLLEVDMCAPLTNSSLVELARTGGGHAR